MNIFLYINFLVSAFNICFCKSEQIRNVICKKSSLAEAEFLLWWLLQENVHSLWFLCSHKNSELWGTSHIIYLRVRILVWFLGMILQCIKKIISPMGLYYSKLYIQIFLKSANQVHAKHFTFFIYGVKGAFTWIWFILAKLKSIYQHTRVTYGL